MPGTKATVAQTTTAQETVETVETVQETQGVHTTLPSIETLIGRDADDVTKALLARSDCKNYPNMVITNITLGSAREGNLTIVVNKALPQFMLDPATGAYEESSSRNLFTTQIQIAAILKAQGEMLLAKAVLDGSLSVIMAILKGARISAIGRFLAAGEAFCNPYAGRVSDNQTTSQHDRYQYYTYEITLADKSVIMQEIQLAKLLG